MPQLAGSPLFPTDAANKYLSIWTDRIYAPRKPPFPAAIALPEMHRCRNSLPMHLPDDFRQEILELCWRFKSLSLLWKEMWSSVYETVYWWFFMKAIYLLLDFFSDRIYVRWKLPSQNGIGLPEVHWCRNSLSVQFLDDFHQEILGLC